MEWIEIKFSQDDGSPMNVPYDARVLVPPTKRCGMTVAKFSYPNGWETETCSEWVGIYRPTHFAYLPDPPEGCKWT